MIINPSSNIFTSISQSEAILSTFVGQTMTVLKIVAGQTTLGEQNAQFWSKWGGKGVDSKRNPRFHSSQSVLSRSFPFVVPMEARYIESARARSFIFAVYSEQRNVDGTMRPEFPRNTLQIEETWHKSDLTGTGAGKPLRNKHETSFGIFFNVWKKKEKKRKEERKRRKKRSERTEKKRRNSSSFCVESLCERRICSCSLIFSCSSRNREGTDEQSLCDNHAINYFLVLWQRANEKIRDTLVICNVVPELI